MIRGAKCPAASRRPGRDAKALKRFRVLAFPGLVAGAIGLVALLMMALGH
jgi:hypothetical protein